METQKSNLPLSLREPSKDISRNEKKFPLGDCRDYLTADNCNPDSAYASNRFFIMERMKEFSL